MEDLDLCILLKDITLYVDPIDGTREIVEGCVWNVQFLIGITHRERSVAGFIGLLFFGSQRYY